MVVMVDGQNILSGFSEHMYVTEINLSGLQAILVILPSGVHGSAWWQYREQLRLR